MSDTELQKKEQDAVLADTAADFSPHERAEFDALDDRGGFYTDAPESEKRRFSGWKKRAGIGGIAGIAGTIGIFSILQGPFQFIHKAQLLQKFHFSAQDHFGDDRSAKFVYYMLLGKSQQGRLGIISNKVADKWEKRLNENSGLKSVYSRTTGRLVGYEIIDANKAGSFVADMQSEGIPRTKSLAGNVGDFVDFSTDGFRNRRSVVRTATRSIGINKIQSSLGARLHIKRAGVNFHPLSRAKKSADDLLERRRLLKESLEAEIETGDPNAPDPPSLGKRTEIIDKLKSFANSAKGPAAVAAVVCGIKSFDDSIDSQNFENIQQLKRMGMQAIAVGSQVMSNKDFDMESLAVLNETNYDEETGTSWNADPGVQAENGQEPTGIDYNQDVKPGSSDKPTIFDVVNQIPTSFFGLNVCGAIDAASNLPLIKQASDAFSDKMNDVLASVGIPTPDELAERGIDYFSTGGVDVLAQGAERGGLENIGTRLAANDQFIANGGRELSDSEAANVKTLVMNHNEQEFAKSDAYEKYFDITNSESVAAKAYIASPKNGQQLASAVAGLPKLFGSISSSIFGSKKVAAATTYDYGFPLYGFSLTEQNNPQYDNGFANADYIEVAGRLEQLNNEFGDECFGMTISRAGDLIYSTAPDMNKLPEKCNDVSNSDLTKYRFYIADMVTAHTLSCYEGDETSCTQLGFGRSGSTSSTPTQGSAKGIDTSAQTCVVGTDGGIGITPDPNVKIRLCVVEGITVNVAIAQNVDSAVKGARSQSINLGGSGYRSYDRQVELRKEHCGTSQFDIYQKRAGLCSPPTAVPGTSLHEWGLAVDFTCNGGSVSRSGLCFRWLESNQGVHKLINLPSEPWHWSSTGN